jgi:hypothetical protein
MSYIKPSDVHAPKRFWSLIHVIFDGGPGSSSLAIGRWENNPVLAMRWNGTEENPLGNPQSRGLPTWFVVPDQHWKQILETEQYSAIKEDTVNLARNFLELKRVYFVNHCPNPECPDYQKLVLHEYRMEQTGDILEQLKQKRLRFYHIICDGFWDASPQDQADLTAVLTAARENHRLGSGVRLSARLLDDGTVVTCLSGLSLAAPSPSRPQHNDMLIMQLDTKSTLSPDQKEGFLKVLRKKGTADIFIPENTSKFFC